MLGRGKVNRNGDGMNLKPCLIFSNYPMRPTDGGPSGFLGQNLVGASSEYYHLGRFHEDAAKSPLASAWQRLGGARKRELQKAGYSKATPTSAFAINARRNFRRENGSQYPWVWFHDVANLAACLDLLGPAQKVILQSHCPQLPSEEWAESGTFAPEDVTWMQKAEAA